MEFLSKYETYLLPHIVRAFSTFIVALSAVYLSGRMLGIARTDVQRNLVATVCIIASNIAYSCLFSTPANYFIFAWDVAVYSSLSIILYVLLGFKLYDRVDNLLDKKIADNKKKK